VYRYDRTTGEVLYVEYWWADLAIANSIARDDRPPVWVKEFSAREGYNLANMSPASWQALGESFLTDEALLNAYMRNFYKGAPPRHFSTRTEGPTVSCRVLAGTPEERHACSAIVGGDNYNSSSIIQDGDDLDLFMDFTISKFMRCIITTLLTPKIAEIDAITTTK